MTNLRIRKLDDRLKALAKSHAVSLEEEAPQTLPQGVSAPSELGMLFETYFGKDNGVDLALFEQRKSHEPMDFQ